MQADSQTAVMDQAKAHQTLPVIDLYDYWQLLKPRVMSLVVFTGFVGMMITPDSLHPILGLTAVLAIALASGGAGAVNMWYDRDIDAIMKRTQARPIPAGKIEPESALVFGLAIIFGAVVLMGLALNWLAAFMLAFAAFFYIVIYTLWLKRTTPQNIVIGGAAGAFPPMIGWLAVTGSFSLDAFLLFLLIFFWTPPHFWALSLFRADDYREANIPMLPVTHGRKHTKWQMLGYCLLLLPLSLAPVATGLAGWLYGAGAAGLSCLFILSAVAVLRESDHKNDRAAKSMFGFSIIYLFGLFTLLLVDYLYRGVENGLF